MMFTKKRAHTTDCMHRARKTFDDKGQLMGKRKIPIK